MKSKKVRDTKTTLAYNQKITSSVFKANMRYPSIGSNLILIGLLKILRQEIQSFTRVYFKNMYLANMVNNSQYFLFQLEMQKIQMMWNISIICSLYFVSTKRKTVFDLEEWLLHFSMLNNMLLQELLQGELNYNYITKNMDTQVELNLQLQLCLPNKKI